MSNETQSIHEFDLNIIYDYFSNTQRQGPGTPEITLKALSFIDGLTENSKIADIGCGTGHHVAALSSRNINTIGIDISPAMIKKAKENFPNYKFKVADALNGSAFESGSFTHIFLKYFFY